MPIPQEIKDRVEASLSEGHTHVTTPYARARPRGAMAHIVRFDSNDRMAPVWVKVARSWVTEDDCLELAVYFKKLAKKIREARGGL